MKKVGLTVVILAGLTSLGGVSYAATDSYSKNQDPQQAQSPVTSGTQAHKGKMNQKTVDPYCVGNNCVSQGSRTDEVEKDN